MIGPIYKKVLEKVTSLSPVADTFQPRRLTLCRVPRDAVCLNINNQSKANRKELQ